jgi:subtilisin-like proprotein convertase family protein
MTTTTRFSVLILVLLCLAIVSPAGVFMSTDVPQSIWDNHTTTSTVTVPPMVIQDVNVLITTLYHSWMADLAMWITSPQGTSVALYWYYGGSADNMLNTIFDDSAPLHISQGWPPYGGSYRPVQPLSAFIGENAGGVWTLFIRDNVSYDTGSLQAWGLEINGQVVPEPATMVLVGAGLTAVIWLRRRRAA